MIDETLHAATLTAATHEGARILTLDCPHGSMAATCRPGVRRDPAAPLPTERGALEALLLGHATQYGPCPCTRDLEVRYGMTAPTPPADETERRLVLAVLAGDPGAMAHAAELVERRGTNRGGRQQ